jgi:hypothetical protein
MTAITSHPQPAPARPLPLRAVLRRHRRQLILAGATLLLLNLWLWGASRNDVLAVAYAYPDGGGYCPLSDTGVAETIRHDGSVILPASKTGGSYCCGFTFQVAMKVAETRGLLKAKTPAEIRRFQQEWYGSAKGTALKECALAVANLGIGYEVPLSLARPGDFITFQRVKSPGHSAIFLEWIKDATGTAIGLRYRSSQGSTRGVGDSMDYFSDSGIGTVRRDQCFAARLYSGWPRYILHPFDG